MPLTSYSPAVDAVGMLNFPTRALAFMSRSISAKELALIVTGPVHWVR